MTDNTKKLLEDAAAKIASFSIGGVFGKGDLLYDIAHRSPIEQQRGEEVAKKISDEFCSQAPRNLSTIQHTNEANKHIETLQFLSTNYGSEYTEACLAGAAALRDQQRYLEIIEDLKQEANAKVDRISKMTTAAQYNSDASKQFLQDMGEALGISNPTEYGLIEVAKTLKQQAKTAYDVADKAIKERDALAQAQGRTVDQIIAEGAARIQELCSEERKDLEIVNGEIVEKKPDEPSFVPVVLGALAGAALAAFTQPTQDRSNSLDARVKAPSTLDAGCCEPEAAGKLQSV